MKKLILQFTVLPAIILLCLTFSCQQQGNNIKAEEEMKALMDSYIEIWNEGNLSLLDEILSPKFVRHQVDISEDIIGIDAMKENVTFYRTGYPDFNVTFDELIIKGDSIAERWTATGTNTGPFGDLPPTGKKTKISGVTISHVVDGKVSEQWIFYNQAALLTQLGYTITPPPEADEDDDDDEN